MDIWQTAIALLATAAGVTCATHALLRKREPRAALGWLAVCLLVPVIGAILYVMFGINRVHARARRLQQQDRHLPKPDHDPVHVVAVSDDLTPLAKLSGSLQHWPLTTGNLVVPLLNGDSAYAAMLAAIRGAQERVFLSSYIFDPGLGFVSALEDAQARGVDVRVIVDGIGEWYSWPHISRELKRRRIRVRRFNPPSLFPPSLQINLRNHRKILAIDGTTAFAGGMNLAHRHLAEEGTELPAVVDRHFRFEGPVVGQLEQVFLEDWERVTGEDAPAAPRIVRAGDGSSVCRALTDGPGEDMDKLTMVLTGAVSLARREVLVMTPYFLPPRELTGALVGAALRGVDVSIILPGTNNLAPVHWATQRMLWELLRYDVRVFYQPGPFVHSKLFVVDGEYAQVGSSNLDPRSLRLNFELAVEIFDAQCASALAADCRTARRGSHEVTLTALDARPLPLRLRNSLAWLLSPYL